VNITGGDIFLYSRLEELASLLRDRAVETRICAHYLNVLQGAGKLPMFRFDNVKVDLLVTLPCDGARLQACLDSLDALKLESRISVVVTSGSEMKSAECLLDRWPGRRCQLKPYYDGQNRRFFERNVFIGRNDILKARPRQSDIYVNSKINRSSFGGLVVTSRGSIHADLNTPRLGVLGQDSICDVLAKEMKSGKSWQRIRSRLRPCRECVYETLCPPPSGYEYAFRRNNLCHVRS
jgi:pseudo-rSAM protein